VALRVEPTDLPGVLLVQPVIYRDGRGFFFESWQRDKYRELGLPGDFVQDNVSLSAAGTLRGLHLQEPFAQGKLIQVLDGEIFDVAVDVRAGSPTFGRWTGQWLSQANGRQMYVPPGFAHGFYVRSAMALVSYKCTEVYHPEAEFTIAWNDPDVAITWPASSPVLSPKDAAATRLAEVPSDRLPKWTPGRTDLAAAPEP
jgi:dTDP-4-dehydrorhamnose 3,5-epimerase